MKNLILISSLILAGAITNFAIQNQSRVDITAGAAFIFKRPENPKTRTRTNENSEVEDAISLGNAARDRTPPDFESAEKAYRLAGKLNPRDPRPYLGLANLYWDQRKYPEAAKAYRDALRYMDPRKRAFNAARLGNIVGQMPDASLTQTRFYLAATLLQEQNAMGAELELRGAGGFLFDNAGWNALHGYALSAQGRFTEAATAFEKAVKLEPANDKYKELLKEATEKAREASANDQAIATALRDTTWEVRDAANSTIKGTCKLEVKAALNCQGLDFSSAKWRVGDGLFQVDLVEGVCVGRFGEEKMDVKCYREDRETNDVWIKSR